MNELTVCGAAAASSAISNDPHEVSTVAVYDLVVSIASGGADGNVVSFGFGAFASRQPAFTAGLAALQASPPPVNAALTPVASRGRRSVATVPSLHQHGGR